MIPRRLLRAIGARPALAWMTAIATLAAAAPWIAPSDPARQEDVAGARFLPPLSRAHALRRAGDPDRTLIVQNLARTDGGWRFTRAGETREIKSADLLEEPAPRLYLLGTDALGRDLTSRLLYAARRSLAIAAASVALAMAIGIAVGAAAGLSGGWLDAILMRSVDVLLSIPRLLIYLMFATLVAPSTPGIVVVLGFTTWTDLARLVRAEVVSRRAGDVVLAARALGAGPLRVLDRHLLPQIAPLLAVSAALRFADTILLESSLGFLGLSSPPPSVSLGELIASGRDFLADAWWIGAWPGLLLATLVLVVRSSASRALGAPQPSSTL